MTGKKSYTFATHLIIIDTEEIAKKTAKLQKRKPLRRDRLGTGTLEDSGKWPDPAENLPEQVRENIERFHLFNPTPEEFRELLKNAGFREVQIHLKDGEDWICAEGHK